MLYLMFYLQEGASPFLIFSKSWVFPPPKEPTRVILVSFDHFALPEFNVWLWLLLFTAQVSNVNLSAFIDKLSVKNFSSIVRINLSCS